MTLGDSEGKDGLSLVERGSRERNSFLSAAKTEECLYRSWNLFWSLLKIWGGLFFFIGFDDGLWGFFGLGRGLFLWDCFGSRQFGFVGVFCWVFFFLKHAFQF